MADFSHMGITDEVGNKASISIRRPATYQGCYVIEVSFPKKSIYIALEGSAYKFFLQKLLEEL